MLTKRQITAGLILLREHRAAIVEIRDHFTVDTPRWQALNARLAQADEAIAAQRAAGPPEQRVTIEGWTGDQLSF